MWTSSRHAAKPCSVFKASLTKGQFDVLTTGMISVTAFMHHCQSNVYSSLQAHLKVGFMSKINSNFFTPFICLINRIILQVR